MIYSTNPEIEHHVDRLLTGAVRDLMRDPTNEISINAGGQVFVDSGRGAPQKTGIMLAEGAIHTVIRLLVAANGRYLDADAPFANLDLACGARFHGALMPVANEPQISIRLHFGMGRPLTDFATPEQVRVITDTIANRRSIIIGGATSSGKSTMTNAIVNELIPWDARIVLIEDVFELRPDPSRNIVRRLATSHADTREHVKQSLRLRPDWLLIGETRDRSAWDLMDASRTGHPGLSTVHASSAAGILTRLQSLAGCDHQFVNEAVDLAVFVARFRDGKRKVTQMLVKQPDQTWADTCPRTN